MTQVIAVANQKGGVAKTTTVTHLGAAIAALGHKVLLVDMDPQANASSGVGVRHADKTIYDVLIGELSARRAITDTAFQSLKVLPASMELSSAAIELDASSDNMRLLSKALIGVRPNFDFIVVDAPPSLGALTLNALVAANHLVIPLQTEYYALEGIAGMIETVERLRGSLNPDLNVLGILLTMFDSRTRLSQEVEENVRKHFGELVFKAVIPRNVRLAEAPSYGQPIYAYAPNSSGAAAYRSLAAEVVERVSEA